MKKEGNEIGKKIKELILSQEFMEKSRYSEKYFTRKRKLLFSSIILFMINIVKQSIQKELTNFIQLISLKKENVTKSAFCQSRMKLKPEAFVMMNDTLTKEFYTDNSEKRWKGFRLLAVDGSNLQLPKSKDIIDEFGCKKNQYGEGMPIAKISTCYDVLNEIIFDAQIANNRTSEYNLALKHLGKKKEKDFFIYDRGYGAMWFMYKHLYEKRDFLMRMQRRSIKEIDLFFDSNEESKIIEITELTPTSKKRVKELNIEFKPFKIRLVKVLLDDGQIEVLATSLLDEVKYQNKIFKELYWKRWGIETSYGHLKSNLQLEDFTGISSLSIKQDFFASIFILNMQSLIILDANDELKKKKTNNKYKYKINRRISLGLMKDRVIQMICQDGKEGYEELKKLFKLELVPIRLNRKNKRPNRCDRKKFFMNKKRVV